MVMVDPLNPLAAGEELANRVLAELNDDPPPQPRRDPLGELVAWVDIERDIRWVDIHIAVNDSGNTLYTVEAHTLDPCEVTGGRVDHVYRAEASALAAAARHVLYLVRSQP